MDLPILPRRKSDVFKVPDSPPPPKQACQRLAEIEAEMEAARETRNLTKIDLAILASLEQAKMLQKDLENLQSGKVFRPKFN